MWNRVLHQTEQECPLKIFFCFWEDKKVWSLCWRSVAIWLGFLCHKTKTYQNRSADLVARKFRMQPNYTIIFHWEHCTRKSWGRFKQESRMWRSNQMSDLTIIWHLDLPQPGGRIKAPQWQRTDHCWKG